MNYRINQLIGEISTNFKSVYGKDINDFRGGNYQNLSSLKIINIEDWGKNETEFALENILVGIKYYLNNFVKNNKTKFDFPIASYNSILDVIENKQMKLVVYINSFPSFNKELKSFLMEKGYLN
jgi:hypothetical protein